MATYNVSSLIVVDASAQPTVATYISSTTWDPDTSPIRWGVPSLISVSVLRETAGGGGGGPTRPASGLVYPIIV